MSESEWLKCSDPIRLLHFLRAKPNSRKVLLLTCACLDRAEKRDREALREWRDIALAVAERKRSAKDLERYEIEHDPASAIRSWALAYVFESLWLTLDEDYDPEWAKRYRPEEVGAQRTQAELVREIFPSPMQRLAVGRACRAPLVKSLAQQIYDRKAFGRMSELADALERAGCKDVAIIDHCRRRRGHVRGCWAVDLILGKK